LQILRDFRFNPLRGLKMASLPFLIFEFLPSQKLKVSPAAGIHAGPAGQGMNLQEPALRERQALNLTRKKFKQGKSASSGSVHLS
jgi:hypothetical protein